MIIEIGHLDIKPGREKDFEAAVVKAAALIQRANGYVSF
jgi:heme-degrading monooxygenase HmoA